MKNPYDTYRRTEISTASPLRLIVLLYEGAIRNIRRGELLLRRPDSFAESSTLLLKAMDIVTELMGCLKPDASPEIADNLSKLYTYVIDRISQSLQDRDPAPLVEAVEILQSLRSTWSEIDTTTN